MVMKEQLQWLTENAPGWAAERAKYALEITSMYEQGELAESEYRELMGDLITADKFHEEADNLEVKNYLVAAVMLGAKLA
jgi:hypothetical protein